ncbi:MAG: type II toxin-antitoxin system VapC family toxin [Candidatus Nanohaloarchaea archaeon]|nr:type II toxin-antitoxin system VapC family toxin [Candidatus Nanohaloarchaea archaeon]
MILLDTSVLIDLLRGDQTVTDRLEDQEATLATTYPIACELYKGVYKSDAPEKGEKTVKELLDSLEYIEPGKEAAQRFGELKQHHPDVSEFDLMIAAVASAANATLLTRDQDFQQIDEINVDLI